jgi:hypothetical protein
MKKKLITECLRIAYQNNTPTKHPQWECYHHFSFVIQKNDIINWGTNRSGNALTAVGYGDWQKIHSEFEAWRKSKNRIGSETFEMLNIRLTKLGKIRDSRPCDCCYNFLKNLNCRRISFSMNGGKFATLCF